MNTKLLHIIIQECTGYPKDPSCEMVDLVLLKVGVRAEIAEKHKASLIEFLRTYPQPERLAQGPSYIEVGAEIGDQGMALALFAVGHVLGLWKIITPMTMGVMGEDARQMAGAGFVMISGFDARG